MVKYFHLIISMILASLYCWGTVSRIHVSSEAYGTHGAPLLLGHFAKFEGFDPEIVEQLKKIPVVNVSRSDQPMVISNRDLSQIIRTEIRKIVPHHVLLHLPTALAVKFRSQGKDLSNSEVVARLKAKFHALCHQCEFEVSNLRIVEEKNQRKCDQWELPKIVELPKGTFVYPLFSVCEEKKENPLVSPVLDLSEVTLASSSAKIYGKVRVLAAVPVVQRSMGTGEIIQAEDVKLESRDITMSSDGIIDSNEYLNRPTKINLVPGQVLGRRHLDRIKAVRKNEAIRMMLGDNAWQISTIGIAQENGYLGDTIKIINPTTQKVVIGELIEKGVARLR